MEFLKKLFTDKPMTYDEFMAVYNAQKGAKDGMKLANLSDGQYVDKAKLDAKEQELVKANGTIQSLQDAAKKFDGVDVAALQQQNADLQKKYDQDVSSIRMDSAVEIALTRAGARNTKAAKALLDLTKAKVKEDGSVEGIDVDTLKKSAPYLFVIEEKKDEGAGHEGGQSGATKDDKPTARTEIRDALFGTAK